MRGRPRGSESESTSGSALALAVGDSDLGGPGPGADPYCAVPLAASASLLVINLVATGLTHGPCGGLRAKAELLPLERVMKPPENPPVF